MRRLVAALVLLCGCSVGPAERPEKLLASARAGLRRGEQAKAQSEAERGLAAAESRGDRVSEWQFRLLRCEILLNSRLAEEVLPQLREPMPATADFTPLRARRKTLEGQALLVLARFEAAGDVLNEAHRLAEAAHDQEDLASVEMLEGSRLIRLERWRESENTLRSAIEHARAAGSTYLEAGALVNLGMSRVMRGHYDAAAGFFERAAALAGEQARTLYSVAQANLATCYYHLGEFDRAIQLHLQAVARHERSGAKLYLQQALGEAGHAYMLRGEPKQAVVYLRRALGVAMELKRTADAAIWAGNLSHAYGEAGDWDNADRFNTEAIQIKSGIHSRTLVYNVLNSARIAMGRGNPEQAGRLYREALAAASDNPAVQWDAHAGLGAVARRLRQPELATRHFEAALAVVERTRSSLLGTEFKLPFLARLIQFYQQYVDALMEQGQAERAMAVADSSRAQVLAEHYGPAPERRLAAAAFRKLARDNKAVLLTYWLGPARSYVWVVTPERIYHAQLPPASEIGGLVAAYRAAIERQLADPLRTRLPAGERLFQILIEPVRRWIPRGARLIVVPDGVLHGLNFETLPDTGDSPHYWIEDITIAIAPSLGRLGQTPKPAPRAHGLLLLGDPKTSDPAFPELRHAGLEIESVTGRYAEQEREVFRREAATPEAYRKSDPGRFALIHFAAHATANRESPLDSAVLLSGGKLYAREVMNLPLNAGLVTASACRGVGVRAYSGEGLVGFAWAFLRAGARNVIAGLWDVDDRSTAALMDVLYREIAAGRHPAEALRTAKLSLLGSRGNYQKPYYWGPFQVYTVAP